MALVGDVTVTVFNTDMSADAGTDIDRYLKSLSEEKERNKQKDIANATSTTVLKEKMALFIPFGCIHAACPLATARESIVKEVKPKK